MTALNKIEGEEITDKDIALDFKETELLLKRARLNMGLSEKLEDEPEPEDEERQKILDKIPY